MQKRYFSSVIKNFNVRTHVGKQKHYLSTSWTLDTRLESLSSCRWIPRLTNLDSFRNFHSSLLNNSSQDNGGKLSSGEKLSSDLVHHLERTSLVDFDSAEAVTRLTEAVRFADQLFEVNTEGVEPLVTVLENESLYLREDIAEQTNRKDILKNASVTEEDYFVAPPGNIPLEPTSKF
ncbi:Glutamyl-tRNA(Gln) amidotransferase subunit C, mitochondrial [Orchesella cincta]|uniref:Glutamyl-tRNA(Gln) amidotransferase subunit C, mitochondrial n=1 Tax=Orchesella cincta TaxID=48709 RepID=A0A1D2N0M2_ORCCI|nr:Glutamyl-tRNA(Gln) amidotransferase subunit C, mitochondrial [Orchesella cincta]